MKKLIIFAAVLAMLWGMAFGVCAAGDAVKISNTTAEAGDTVYLTVSLTKKTVGDTIGVSFTYDNAVLEWLPDASTWEKKGALQDFGSFDNSGVWTADKAADLKGDICVLAFKVREDAAFTETAVNCTVLVKNGAKEVGSFETAASISMKCDHEFGEWAQNGDLGHTRTCTRCGGHQTQSHSWDEGTLAEDPTDPGTNVRTRTCTVCGETKTERVAAENRETVPAYTEPTQPPATEPGDTRPQPTEPWEIEEDHRQPTAPEETRDQFASGSEHTEVPDHTHENEDQHTDDRYNQPTDYDQPKDYNQPENEAEEATYICEDGHVHYYTNGEGETIPMAVPAATVHDHDHDHEYDEDVLIQEGKNGAWAVLVIVAVLAVCAGTAEYFRKKKK